MRDRFPYFCHRTLAEVAETEALMALAVSGRLPPNKVLRLDSLSVRAEANNPPEVDELPWSVA